MKFFKLSLVVLACFHGAGAMAQAERTLAQSAAQALASFPEIKAALANRRAVETTVDQARAALFPSIDLTLGRGREVSDNVTSRALGRDITLNRQEAEITLSQLLFDGGAAGGQIRRGEARAKGADEQFAAAAENAALRAVQAHIEVKRLGGLILLAEDNVKRHRDTLVQVSALVESGRGRGVDTQQTEARLAFAQASLSQLRGQLAQADAAYRHLVGVAPGNLADPGDFKERLPSGIDDALNRALTRHPNVRSAEQEMLSAQSDRETARARLLIPRIALEAGATRSRNLDGIQGLNADQYAVLRLRAPLSRGGADDARVRETQARIDEAYFNLGKARNDVERELRQAWDTLREDRERFPQLGRYVTASSEVVSAYRAQFMIGQRTLLDVLNAENELFNAKSSLYSGLFALTSGEVRVLAAAGLLVETLGIHLPNDYSAEATSRP